MEKSNNLQLICFKYFLPCRRDPNLQERIQNSFVTNNAKPKITKLYRYQHDLKEEVRAQINKMFQQGIIRPFNSPWSSSVDVAPKKFYSSGRHKWRVEIDFHKQNESSAG